MTVARHDLLLRQGDTFNDVWTVFDEAGNAVDLTGYSARMFFRATLDSPTTLLEATTANGRITLGGTLGTVTFNVPANVTAALPAGNAVYDLEVTSASGVVTTWAYGTVTVVKKATR